MRSPSLNSVQIAALEDPVVSLHVESLDLKVDLKIDLTVKPRGSKTLYGLLLAAADALESNSSLKIPLLNKRLERSIEERQERHLFYSKVAERYEEIACQMNNLKRDYFLEIDSLRQELAHTTNNPMYLARDVRFCDPALYKVPTWQEVVEQLNELRAKRDRLWHPESVEARSTQTDNCSRICSQSTQTSVAHSAVREESVQGACCELTAVGGEALKGKATIADDFQNDASKRCCLTNHRRTVSEPCASKIPCMASTFNSATIGAMSSATRRPSRGDMDSIQLREFVKTLPLSQRAEQAEQAKCSSHRNSRKESKRPSLRSQAIGDDASPISVQTPYDDCDACDEVGAKTGPVTDGAIHCSKWELRVGLPQQRLSTDVVSNPSTEEKAEQPMNPSRHAEQRQNACQVAAVQCQLVDIASKLEEASALNNNLVYMTSGRRIALPRLKSASRSQRRAPCPMLRGN